MAYLESLASTWELPTSVIKALDTEGFTSKPAVLGLSMEDIESFSLKRGEKAALVTAITRLQQEFGSGPLCVHGKTMVTEKKPDPSLLHELLSTGREADSVAALAAATARLDLDPHSYLRKPQGMSKPLLIPDYVSEAMDEEGEEIELGQGHTLKLRQGPKTKLLRVSPAQWISANMRIMAELYESAVLDSESIVDYMAYTAKIGELATRYTWQSVLLYDQDYRKKQAAAGFRWGADSHHLVAVHLKERAATGSATTSAKRQTTTGNRKIGPGGKEICLQYNAGKCQYGAKCNFEHVCVVCYRSHPQVDHRTMAPKQEGAKDQ